MHSEEFITYKNKCLTCKYYCGLISSKPKVCSPASCRYKPPFHWVHPNSWCGKWMPSKIFKFASIDGNNISSIQDTDGEIPGDLTYGSD